MVLITLARLRRLFLKRHLNQQFYSSTSTADTAFAAASSAMKTLWCGQVVFGEKHKASGGQQEEKNHQLLPGSIDIIGDTIVACNPGESLVSAKKRRRVNSSNNNINSVIEEEVLDLGENFCLAPGLIDVHTHISALGRNWEGYATATKAAAAGGITTIIGMPLNSIPSTTTLEAVNMERQAATDYPLYVDVGLWGGVVPGNIGHESLLLQKLLESPYVLGLKAFLAPLPPAAGYDSVTPQQLLDAAKICSAYQKPILVHSELMTAEECEDAVVNSYSPNNDNIKAGSSSSLSILQSYSAHLQSRPAKWEQDAVRVVCEAAKFCSMHIVHLSDGRGCLPLIQECKNQHTTPLTVETCPHYLLLDQDKISDGDTRIKCFPPIRDSDNRELLWKGLEEGWIDMIASDHSPCEPDMRLMDTGNLKNAWGGLSGLQYQLQATWTEGFKRGITPIEIAKWWSENPARLIRIPNKGRISVGQQADLCWWDPNYEGAPNDYSQEYHRWAGTTYFADNPSMRGRVLGTWVRGQMVYDGQIDEHKNPKGVLLKSLEADNSGG